MSIVYGMLIQIPVINNQTKLIRFPWLYTTNPLDPQGEQEGSIQPFADNFSINF